MATRVQNFKAQSVGSVTSLSVTPVSNVTAGNLIVMPTFYGDDTLSASVNDATNGAGKDSLGNVWSTLGPLDISTDGDFLYIFYSILTVTGADTIRVLSQGGNARTIKMIGSEVSPTTSWALDQGITSQHNATGVALSAGTQTPVATDGYALVAYVVVNGASGLSQTSPWGTNQVVSNDVWLIIGDRIFTSVIALVPTATISTPQENGGILVVFGDVAGAAPSYIPPDLAHSYLHQPILAQ